MVFGFPIIFKIKLRHIVDHLEIFGFKQITLKFHRPFCYTTNIPQFPHPHNPPTGVS